MSIAKKTVETRLWEAAKHPETEEHMAAYLDAVLEDGDPAQVVAALGDIARTFMSCGELRSSPSARVV